MEGVDEKWSPLSSENKADYRNLPPGDFTFKVKARGVANSWSDVFEYRFRILPPWWQTTWAYIAYGLIALGILYYLRRLELKKQKRKFDLQQEKLAQERKVNEQLRRVDRLKDQFLANTSHELRTPLQGIIGISESLCDDAERVTPEILRENLSLTISSGKRLNYMVFDPFAGSKTSGAVGEKLQRRWIASEKIESYLEGSKFRFQ